MTSTVLTTKRCRHEFHELVRFSVLASETDPFDPMEKAFKELGDRYLDDARESKDWTLGA